MANLWEKFNELIGKLRIEEKIIQFYEMHLKEIPEFFKLLLFIFLAIIIVLGVMSFIKKTLKLFIILIIIAIIIIAAQ